MGMRTVIKQSCPVSEWSVIEPPGKSASGPTFLMAGRFEEATADGSEKTES